MTQDRSLLPHLFFLLGFAFFVLGLEQAFPVFVDTYQSHTNGDLEIHCARDRRWVASFFYAMAFFLLAFRYHRERPRKSIKPAIFLLGLIIIQLAGLLFHLDDGRAYVWQMTYARAPEWWERSRYLGRPVLDPLFACKILLFLATLALGVPLIFANRKHLLRLFGRPPAPGLCAECGYDLYGNQSGICPKCGTPIEAPSSEKQGLSTGTESDSANGALPDTSFSPRRRIIAASLLLLLTCGLWRVLVWHRSFAPPGDYDLTARLWVGVQPETGALEFQPIFINQGHDSIREWTYDVRLEIDGQRSIEMPKGWTFPARSFTYSGTKLAFDRSPGSHTYRLIIDSENRVQETNEDNNILEGTILVLARPPAETGERGTFSSSEEALRRERHAWTEAQEADLLRQGLRPPPRP